ncbi:MAG: tetratricopeptide repeat protein [Ignavibacteria bacterium]|nr:tetratricopeptide repeat protein [Ignavibacteria bacterium]
MKSILTLFLLVIIGSVSNVFSAENTLQRVVISPTRILLYCSHPPQGFTSQLSPDKRRITLNFPSYSATDETRMTQGRGVIEDVYVKQAGKNIQVMIQLNDKKGFTTVQLPYSHALMIDVFSWDSLSKSEDVYRTALLGSEKEITPSAYQAIAKSANMKWADALFFSGVNALQSGDLDKANAQLNSALEYQSAIPDIYAALAQIARMKNQPDKAKRFQEEYATKSGIRSILDIPAQYQPPTDTSATQEPTSFAYILDEHSPSDSIENVSIPTVAAQEKPKDTTRFASIFSESDSQSKPKHTESGMIDDWMKTSAIAGIGFVVSAAFYLAWLYLRWRKSKLKERIARSPSSTFDEILAEKTKEPNAATLQKANTLYRQGSIINREISEDEPQQVTTLDEDTMSDLAHLEEYIPREELLEFCETGDDEVEETPSLGEYFPRNEVELALHFQQEGYRHKSTTLKKITSTDIPLQPYKLSKVARKFGVERSSLEVKRTLATLETDTRAMEKLLEKILRHY